MTILTDGNVSTSPGSSLLVKTRMLEQMAEALEDEAAGLYRRAAAFEEEESLLDKEIGDRQTEINRLLLKLDAMRADRDRVIEKVELISNEAAALRERAFNHEDEDPVTEAPCEAPPESVFFRRMTVVEHASRT